MEGGHHVHSGVRKLDQNVLMHTTLNLISSAGFREFLRQIFVSATF